MLKKVNFEEQRTLCEIHINVPRIFLDSTTIMPRNRIRTTNNGDYSPDALKEAIKKCLEGAKVKPTAEAAGIPRPTLIRYVKKAKASSLEQVTFKQNVHLQVFKPEEEKLLAAYVTEASNIHYALTNLRARSLAFDFAQVNNIEVPASWKLNKAAGIDWLRSFMQRNRLSFRTPEAVSLSRATSFNEVNVKRFFDNLRQVKEKYNFLPQDVYNLDETSCVTVHRPPKVIAPRGKRTVSQMTSGERGTLVTMVSIVGATGKAVPPFLIFPRVHYKDHMLRNAPPGSKGAANMSGWMISDLFLPVLEHFVAHERPSLEHPKLIVLDNHESHLSISGIDYARANGIILLTLHPHTSNKLQPLDVAVFKPFKTFFNQAGDKWLLNHPGSTISIYEIAELVGEAFPKSFTPQNICSGFKKTGIEPFNCDVFGPEDYLCSYVTDREDASNGINISPAISSTSNLATEPQKISETLTPQAGPSNSSTETPTSSNAPMVSPQEVRPYPKAGPRKNTAKRAKSTSVILTTTPEKKKLEEKHRRKEENAAKKKTAKERKILKSIFPTFDKKKSSKKKLFDKEDSSESMDSEDVSLHDSDESFEDLEFDEVPKDLEEGSFSLVNICGKTKNSFRYYVCQKEKAYTCGYDVVFFKRVTGTFKFLPTNETGFVEPVDCIVNLPAPIKFKNGRFIGMFAFNYDFEEFSPLF